MCCRAAYEGGHLEVLCPHSVEHGACEKLRFILWNDFVSDNSDGLRAVGSQVDGRLEEFNTL